MSRQGPPAPSPEKPPCIYCLKVEQNVCVCLSCRTRLEIAERELALLRKGRPKARAGSSMNVLGRPR